MRTGVSDSPSANTLLSTTDRPTSMVFLSLYQSLDLPGPLSVSL